MWCLKNINTGEIYRDPAYRDFDQLCRSIDQEMILYAGEIFRRGNRRTIKRHIKELKKSNEVLIFVDYFIDRQFTNNQPTVWDYLKPKLIEQYLAIKYDRSIHNIYIKLISRFKEVLKDKFIVNINYQSDLAELGLIYISARIFDPSIQSEIIIVTQDQLNFLKLVYPENTIWSIINPAEILEQLDKIGLLE